MISGILIAYYPRRDDWLHAQENLRPKLYLRFAGVTRDSHGNVSVVDPFRRSRFVAAAVMGLALALIGYSWPRLFPGVWMSWDRESLKWMLAGIYAVMGVAFPFLAFPRWNFGIEGDLLDEQAEWLVPDESVLIVRAPVERLHIVQALLTENCEVPPAVFVLHPARSSATDDMWRPPPLSLPDLREHARRVAKTQRVDPTARASTVLLRRIHENRRRLREISQDLEESSRLRQRMPPTAEWLLDNQYLVESNASAVLLNLPRRFLKNLPALADGPNRGLPRVYALARDLAAHVDVRLEIDNISAYIEGYQSVAPLSIAELWVLPQMLRVAILENIYRLATRAHVERRENETADLWANRLTAFSRMEPDRLFAVLDQFTAKRQPPSSFFASQLVDSLHDDEAALATVRAWVERFFSQPLYDVRVSDSKRQARDFVAIGNAFTSLRQLGLFDWRDLFEELSHVEARLREDPSGVYPRMDFETRNRCRTAVEELNRATRLGEVDVVSRALSLALERAAIPGSDERDAHVGTYLIGEERGAFGRSLGARESLRYRLNAWIYRHHAGLYLLSLGALSGLIVYLAQRHGLVGAAPWVRAVGAALLVLPASQLALKILNFAITNNMPPRVLPKMDFKDSGIPDEYRTLVVVPMLLDAATIGDEIKKLDVRFRANQENNLLYSLFADDKDSPQMYGEQDELLLRTAREGIDALNKKHGAGRFFLFHRERRWSESEGKFIGWERKRGKLEELNELLDGTRAADAEPIVAVGSPDALVGIRFVITLDSDTQLPHHTARRMVETLAHPLNRPRMDEQGRIVAGYGVIQPRVTPSLPSATGTPFSRLYSNPTGVDPYTNAVSDVYQDLTGQGSYQGKGIYDVHAFSRRLTGRFSDARILSHDLIEGAHVRVGYASDIELFDEFPQDYRTFARREHRWIRGDWQIAEWVFPLVPLAQGGRGPNPIVLFDRWKVFDNLRRSLMSAASVALLVVSWFHSAEAALAASVLVAAQLFLLVLVEPILSAFRQGGLDERSMRSAGRDLVRTTSEAALMPSHTIIALDAIARVFYRRFISGRGLLEWTTADAAGRMTRRAPFPVSMSISTAFALVFGRAVVVQQPHAFFVALPWLVLWASAPAIGWLLDRRPTKPKPLSRLSHSDVRYLRKVSRVTWRYFTDFVGESTHHLPPDNYQVTFQDRPAMRTSPTNIGLAMASVYGAFEMGYATVDDVERSLSRSMESIGKLERFRGHLLNWYDLHTLKPLEPRYVSAVDSGNLIGALWAIERGMESVVRAPVLDAKAFNGLLDLGEVLLELLNLEDRPRAQTRDLIALIDVCARPQPGAFESGRVLKRFAAMTWSWTSDNEEDRKRIDYWSARLRQELAAWVAVFDTYLPWMEFRPDVQEIAGLDPIVRDRLWNDSRTAPSLRDIAKGSVAYIQFLRASSLRTMPKVGQVLEAFDRAQAAASEKLAAYERLTQSLHDLSESIDMKFLYAPKRRLFSIGYMVNEGRLDGSFYDLLASESRLASFVAVARGDVPYEHWAALGRPYGGVGRRRVLLSWSGTMFEYLMPLLFQRSYENSLLDKSARDAVSVQIAYGQRHNIPWGISESAFGDLDVEKTYQYHAFGVPELGLRHAVGAKIVVAPYATMLSLDFAPRESLANLHRLASLGMLGDHGFLESIDFSRQPDPGAQHGVIVGTYMAHHQGMSFLALANFLCGHPLRKRFHSDRRVASAEPLLHERIPTLPRVQDMYTRRLEPATAPTDPVDGADAQIRSPHSSIPQTQLLSNGTMSVMVTNAGGGYLRWNDLDVTRWRSDATRDHWGSFCYVRDVEANKLWCNMYHPIAGVVASYEANFALDRATFHRQDHDIETMTQIVVAPEDDVEIRRMTLINRSRRVRKLELTSYIELAMSGHRSDRQHPAFNKMFIQTEAIAERATIAARRRPRSSTEAPVFVAHRMVLPTGSDEPMRFETDRRRFIGRGHSLANPMGASREPGNTQGFVLDPILSLRRSVQLAPGERIDVLLLLAVAETRDETLSMLDRYTDLRSIERVMHLAWNSAQLQLNLLRLQPSEARAFQKLASHIIYPNDLLRPPAANLAQNRKGQSALWKYAISGDLPIMLVAIAETRDLGLVRQALQAHAMWRLLGLKVDLVILNHEGGSYERPLRGQLDRLVQAYGVTTGVDRPGGVFLRDAHGIPVDDITLLRASASIALAASRGTLAQQFGVVRKGADLPEALARRTDQGDASPPLPFLELAYFNSLGGFDRVTGDYVIYMGPGIHTPAPWVNVMANAQFGTMVSETGAGFTWFGNSQRNRLTDWSNDPILDTPGEAIYLRDEETGVYWSPTASPIREESAYRARHGAGFTQFEHNSHGIEQLLTVFVPQDDRGGEPVKISRLSLRNLTQRTRTISVTYFAEWVLGESREASQLHVTTGWDAESGAVTARNSYNPDYSDRVAYVAIDPPAESHAGNRTVFVGRNRSLTNPMAMERKRLSRQTGAGLDPCGAVQRSVRLHPGEQVDLVCLLGQAPSIEAMRATVALARNRTALDRLFAHTKQWWQNLLGTVRVTTPELAADLLLNHWLLYQSLSSRLWARSAFYQSGGAFGFRDQLQDVMAFLLSKPSIARDQILRSAAHQFPEGDVQHWWHPPANAGIRSRISDDLLWLPYVTAEYVRVTGDTSILHEVVPFLDAPQLEPHQHESFQMPSVSRESATLFEHCKRTIERSSARGAMGLPLIGTGDWNDGMNLVGAEGKGESVWLAWFLVDVLERMTELARHVGQESLIDGYRRDRETLVKSIEANAWDGAWYRRATFDNGTPLGSSKNTEAKIDSLPQSWAAITKAGDTARADIALESAWKYLVREDEGIVQLFDPPFENSEPHPGYIRGYPPGVRENGGQYTHAALWLAMANARRGRGDAAGKILRMINPIEHARETDAVWRYGIEPYVIAADVYRLPGRIGQGGWSWYTGSASWMYRVWIEEVLGLKRRGDTLIVDPSIPAEWPEFTIAYRFDNTLYDIRVVNPDKVEHGVASVEVDGIEIAGIVIPLRTDKPRYDVRVTLGKQSDAREETEALAPTASLSEEV